MWTSTEKAECKADAEIGLVPDLPRVECCCGWEDEDDLHDGARGNGVVQAVALVLKFCRSVFCFFVGLVRKGVQMRSCCLNGKISYIIASRGRTHLERGREFRGTPL